jgi:hypothetical protein
MIAHLNNIYNNHTTIPSTHQHQMYLHPSQQQNPPEPHLLHLPLLPPFTHLPKQPHHSIPNWPPPTSNPTMTTMMTPLHGPPGQPSDSIPNVEVPKFHAKPSTMSSTLHSMHPLRIQSCRPSPGLPIAFSIVLTLRKCAMVLSNP